MATPDATWNNAEYHRRSMATQEVKPNHAKGVALRGLVRSVKIRDASDDTGTQRGAVKSQSSAGIRPQHQVLYPPPSRLTQLHTYTRAHAHTRARTHARTHARALARTHAHTHALTRREELALAPPHDHALAVAPPHDHALALAPPHDHALAYAFVLFRSRTLALLI